VWEILFFNVFGVVYVDGIDHSHRDFIHCRPPAESKRLNLSCAYENRTKE
jgi:hypothetical protein